MERSILTYADFWNKNIVGLESVTIYSGNRLARGFTVGHLC
jgi:hypothetical protein